MADSTPEEPHPGPLNYVLGFTLVGIAWGLTTPFIRRAARDHHPPPHPILDTDVVKNSWLRAKGYGAFFAVVDLLRNPRYAVPLLLNLTGSVWFFLLIGKAGKLSSFPLPPHIDTYIYILSTLPVVPCIKQLGRCRDGVYPCTTTTTTTTVLTCITELSLTVPIVNTLAFLFTVIGDWWVDGKVISRSTCAKISIYTLP